MSSSIDHTYTHGMYQQEGIKKSYIECFITYVNHVNDQEETLSVVPTLL